MKNGDSSKLCELRYGALLETPGVHLRRWKPDATITFISKACEDFFGVKSAEIIGKKWIELASDGVARVEAKIRYNEIIAGTASRSQVNKEFGPDGREYWYLWTDFPIIENGKIIEYQSVGIDITEMREADIRLEESEARFRNIFENAFEGVYKTTPEGKVVGANKALAKLFGFPTPEAMVAGVKNIGEELYADPDSREEVKRMIREKGEFQNFEVKMKTITGENFWIFLNCKLVEEKGEKFFVGTMVDITERRRHEEEMAKKMDELERMNNLMINRELKMTELKEKIKGLEKKLADCKK